MPTATSVTVVPETVQTAGAIEAKLTARPEEAVALTVNGAGDEPKQRGRTVQCRHRLGGLLKYYGRAA